MRAFFDDAPLIEHPQAIHGRNGREPVRNRNHRLALHEPVQTFLDGRLDFAIQRAGGLVQQQNRRVLEHDACNSDALALAAGKLHAALTHLRVIAGTALAVAQFKDEVVRLGPARSFDHLLFTGFGTAVEDVFTDCAMQQGRVLRDHANGLAQAFLRDLANVLPINADTARLQVVKAQQ